MLTKRDFLKNAAGAAAGVAVTGLVGKASDALAQTTFGACPVPPDPEPVMDGPDGQPVPPSPAILPDQAWIRPLTIPPVLQPIPVGSLTGPAPSPLEHVGNGDSPDLGTNANWRFGAPQKHYEITVRENDHEWHPSYPIGKIWGYNGTYPGPTIKARYGEPILVRFRNQLPTSSTGFGVPEVTIHLHNGHQEWKSDGHPTQWFPSGQHRDHYYPMIFAGYENSPATNGDPLEALGTLWYHDHRVEFTTPNVYKGMAGYFLMFDEYDADDETGTAPWSTSKNLRLPSGKYDVTLTLGDKRFDSSGFLAFDPFDFDGFLGDQFTVNGQIKPYLEVERRKYRFRILDGGPSRVYQIALSDGLPMQMIATDGNLLPSPIPVENFRIGVAQRRDVILDFTNYADGTVLYLENQMEQKDGRKPTGKVLHPGYKLLQFRVKGTAPAADPSRVPASLRPLPNINPGAVTVRRTFEFNRTNGMWTINGQIFNGNAPMFTPTKGVPEIWTIRNGGGGWWHPVHIHFEEFRILRWNGGIPPPEFANGRHDVLLLGDLDEADIYIRFRDYKGRYVMHCHNTVHEDHMMMARWDVI